MAVISVMLATCASCERSRTYRCAATLHEQARLIDRKGDRVIDDHVRHGAIVHGLILQPGGTNGGPPFPGGPPERSTLSNEQILAMSKDRQAGYWDGGPSKETSSITTYPGTAGEYIQTRMVSPVLAENVIVYAT